MRRLALLLLSLAAVFPSARAAVQADTLRLKALDDPLARYVETLEGEDVAVKMEECDLLIEAATDSLVRERIARKLYDHYRHSPVMGDEAVAIHLTDKWFATGRVSMSSDVELMDAKVFAAFNRQSLIGMPAPGMELEDTLGRPAALSPGRTGGRMAVLYFYDTGCVKCRAETIVLRGVLEDGDYPVDFYAVYTGSDPEAWREWRTGKWNINAPSTRFHHFWDPDLSSDFQRKYGVLSTPKVFLVAADGTILGRNLDPPALVQLLRHFLSDPVYVYGGAETAALFDRLFADVADGEDGSAGRLSAEVLSVASLLEERTLPRGDTLSYKHLEGDLLYYLLNRREEGFKLAGPSFLDRYILSRPRIWRTRADTLQVITLARMMDDLWSRTPVGSRLPKFPLPGWNRLRRRGGWLVFHTPGCGNCAEVLATLDSLSALSPRKVLLTVDMDALLADDPDLAARLFDTFDLSVMPYVTQIGRRGKVTRKYLFPNGKND